MALALNYPSPYGGADFTYFTIGEVRENRYSGRAEVVLYGFIDQASRQAQAACISVNVAIDAPTWVKDATIAQVYGLVKQTPLFSGAEDV